VAASVAQSLVGLSSDWFDGAIKADVETWLAGAQ